MKGVLILSDLTFLGVPKGSVDDVTNGTIVLIGSLVVSKTEHEPFGQEKASRYIRECSFEYTGYVDYLDRSVVDLDVVDLGDAGGVDLCKTVRGVLDNGGKVIVFGGDHTTTYYALECLEPSELTVLDAHFDFADEKVNPDAEPISHGFINKLLSRKGWRIRIFGARAYSSFPMEFEWARKAGAELYPWYNNQNLLKELVGISEFLSLDTDFFDASSFPATRVPEVGGATPREFIDALRSVQGFKARYVDIVEYAPDLDQTRVCCKIISNIIFELIAKMASD